jgi:hypothetical protein
MAMGGEAVNCPRCESKLYMIGLVEKTRPSGPWYQCDECDWESEPVRELVLASPAYRLAQLLAQGAKPGWYGPDGEPWYCVNGMCSGQEFLMKGQECISKGHARLCGFVEVKE